MTTLTRERKQKFEQLTWEFLENIGVDIKGNSDELDRKVPDFCKALAEASLSRSEIAGEYKTIWRDSELSGEVATESEEINTLVRGDWRDYPEHLHEVAKCLRDTWMFVLPEKPKKGSKKSQYAFFVMAMESIKQSCGEFGIKAMEETHKKWKAGFKGQIAPYTIAKPTSIIHTVAGTALEMRQGGSSDAKSVVIDNSGVPESW